MTKKILLVGANGYVGSRFVERCKDKYNLKCIDSLLKPGNLPSYIEHKDYRDMTKSELEEFGICLWVAGYSSVPLSKANPVDCYENNYSGLVDFTNKFEGMLIYASSGSVYANADGAICDEKTPIGMPQNIYDYTKVAFDHYMEVMGKSYVSLRFGTVDGGSPRIREEVLLNRMVKDALLDKKVNLANPMANRGVLYIEDLVDALELIIDNPPKKSEIFNLNSCNGNMESFANIVLKNTGAKLNTLNDSNAYDFQMTSQKFSDHYSYKFTNDIEVVINNIIDFYKVKYLNK
jgi:nucleoside-diphosphate-sugar epimerase